MPWARSGGAGRRARPSCWPGPIAARWNWPSSTIAASIALPALSTGAYGYPMDLAARVALQTAIDFLREHGKPERVRFVLFDAGAYGAFAAALEKLAK